ncbi:MAG: hypothetical protein QNJ84_11915 [Alphaproteobacteria bacterium]|nr:hypothetical protein [Alphaproteobacteria bacterium]
MRCPFNAHQPLSEEGAQAWDVLLKCAGQLRLGGMGGVAGLDLGAAFTMASALGYDRKAMALLLPAAERGLVAALNAKRTEQD